MKSKSLTLTSKFALLFSFLFLCSVANVFAQEQDSVKVKTPSKKEEANRNVMLNASSATGPRQVPIGIPGLAIDVTINEDNMPVSFHFWPNLPTLHSPSNQPTHSPLFTLGSSPRMSSLVDLL